MASSRIACGFAGLALMALGEAICVAADLGPPFPVESLPTSIDVKCQERFLNEAPPAWKTLGERLRGIELEHTYVDYRPTDTKEPDREVYSSTYCILKDGVSRRLAREQVIDVMNSRYSFSVRRAVDADSLKPFSLKYCERWRQDAPQPQAGWIDVAELKLAMFSTISWLPMEKILTDADFQMTGADTRVNDQGDEVVRIVYRYTADASNDFLLQPDGVYWAELRPRRFWVVVRSGITSSLTKHDDTDAPFRERMTIRYQEWDGVPLPEGVRVEVVDVANNAVVRIQENRFGPPRACSRPVEEFFLPHYGLSDDPLPSIPAQCGPPSSSP